MKHFLLCKEDPVLLILDSYESHLAIPVINRAKGNGSTALLTLLPHISHTLQSLDCTIFGPYKTYYNACLNPGEVAPTHYLNEVAWGIS
jgi:hypothetical protein